MNIKRLNPEEKSTPQSLRVSDRKKRPQMIDSSCFKRPYKWGKKTGESKSNNKNEPSHSTSQEDEDARQALNLLHAAFVPLPEFRLQAKAVQTYRMKKLKRLLAGHPRSLSDGQKVEILAQKFLSRQPSRRLLSIGKSIFAFSRQRDLRGKFQGQRQHAKHGAETITDAGTDDCCSINQTTAPCSQVEPSSFEFEFRQMMSLRQKFDDVLHHNESFENCEMDLGTLGIVPREDFKRLFSDSHQDCLQEGRKSMPKFSKESDTQGSCVITQSNEDWDYSNKGFSPPPQDIVFLSGFQDYCSEDTFKF